MSFAFGKIPKESNKKLKNEIIDNSLLAENIVPNEKHLNILLDDHLKPTQLRIFINWIKKYFKSYTICVATLIAPSEKNVKGSLADFFEKNASDYSRHFKPGVILSIGRATLGLTEGDILVHHLYDVVTNPKSYFFHPKLKSWVFPIDNLNVIFTYGKAIETFYDTHKTNFANWQINKANLLYEDLLKDLEVDELSLKIIDNTEELEKVIASYKRYSHVAWDLETGGFDFVNDAIGVITYSFDGKNGYLTPWSLLEQDSKAKSIFNEMLKSKKQIGSNLKFDVKFAWRNGLTNAYPHEDTVQLGHVLNELSSNGLKPQTWIYTKWGGYEKPLTDYLKTSRSKSYLDIPLNLLADYATKDAILTFQVWKKQREHLAWLDEEFPNPKENGYSATYYYEDIVMKSYYSYCKMEYDGMHVSIEKLDEGEKYFKDKIKAVQEELRSRWDIKGPFDFGSGKSLGNKIEELGWKCHGRAKVGNYYLSGDEQIQQWIREGHVDAKLIQEMRSASTLLNTFIIGWRPLLKKHDDGSYRMHASYSHMLADTGRSKCRNPNLQQIPANEPTVPKCIDVPNKDFVIFGLDYASLQVRLVGMDSKDKTLKKVYGPSGIKDFHSVTGFPIYAFGKTFVEVELEDGTKKQFSHTEKVDVVRKKERTTIYANQIEPEDDLIL